MLTDKEKLARIKKHLDEERSQSADGKTSWERVEDFRLKHGHLPSANDAPCPHCFNERTQARIELAQIKAVQHPKPEPQALAIGEATGERPKFWSEKLLNSILDAPNPSDVLAMRVHIRALQSYALKLEAKLAALEAQEPQAEAKEDK